MRAKALQRLTGNDYAFTVFTKIAAVVIGLIASSVFKRFFGPEIEGQMGTVNAILTIVAVVANFGLYQPYPFHKRNALAEGTRDPGAVLGDFLNIFALQYVVYTVIGVVLACVLRSTALVAICLIAPIQVLANQLSFMVMVEHVRYKNVVFLTARITNTLLIILAAVTLRPLLIVALALVVVGDLITVVMALRKFGRVGNPLRVDFRFFRSILWFGFIAMLTTLLLTLNYQVDMLMLTGMGVADAQRGFYSTGVSLAAYGWLIPDAFREVLFSRTAKADAISDVTFSLKLNFYITVTMLVGIALFGRPVIRLLFGQRYLPAFQVTLILLFGVLSMSFFKLIGTLLLAQGKKMVYLGILAASAMVNVVANLYTIPLWGIEGAAMASVLSYTLAGGAFLAYFLRSYQVPLGEVFVFRKSEREALRHKLSALRRK